MNTPHHPSGALKYCPYCGSARFVWDGIKSFTCSDCRNKLYINAAAAVAVIIENEDGDILLTRRAHDPSKGALDLPGGFADTMETAEEAARREIKEELDMDITELRYLTSFANEYLFGGMIVYTLDMAFAAKVRNTAAYKAADDVAAVEWYAKSHIPFDEIAFCSIRNILAFYTR